MFVDICSWNCLTLWLGFFSHMLIAQLKPNINQFDLWLPIKNHHYRYVCLSLCEIINRKKNNYNISFNMISHHFKHMCIVYENLIKHIHDKHIDNSKLKNFIEQWNWIKDKKMNRNKPLCQLIINKHNI